MGSDWAQSNNWTQAVQKKLLRYKDLVTLGVVSNRMQLSRLTASAGFPAGFKLSENTRVWDSADIEAWLDARRQRAA